uniref:Uncharacterized protein n=1 Tax=Zooxanthella nutricula TaxID=1333877 RepID=A0A7S2LUA2_9DINO
MAMAVAVRPRAPLFLVEVAMPPCATRLAMGLWLCLVLAFAVGLATGSEAINDGEVCYTRDVACWARLELLRPGRLILQPTGQVTLAGFLALCAIVLLTPMCGPVFLTIATALAPGACALCLPLLSTRAAEIGTPGRARDDPGFGNGMLGQLNSGHAMGCMVLACFPVLSRLQLAASPFREPNPWCRGLLWGATVSFWGWLIAVGFCVRKGPLLGDALFAAHISLLVAYKILQLQRGAALDRCLQAGLVGLTVSAWAIVLCDSLALARPDTTSLPWLDTWRYYLHCMGVVWMSWLAIRPSLLGADFLGATPFEALGQIIQGSYSAPDYGAMQAETGYVPECQWVDTAWESCWNVCGVVVPIAVLFSMPWQAQIGFARWPPPMPCDYPKGIVVSKSSLSGYIEAPECMAMLAAAMSCTFANFWRHLDSAARRPASVSVQETACSADQGRRPSASWLHEEAWRGQACVLFCFEVFFGLFMAMTFSFQPLPHIYFTTAFGACAAVLGCWIVFADRRLRNLWWMPCLFVVALVMSFVVACIGWTYGADARLPEHLIVPYPGSPTDDNLFWLCEVTSLSLTCSIASLANTWAEGPGSPGKPTVREA